MSPVEELQVESVVEEVLQRYSPEPSSLISVLQDLQEELYFLPREALDQVSARLGVPRSQCYHVATFYKAFSLEPRGRYTISVCRGTACHVKGAPRIVDRLERELGINVGETTSDRKFTLETVRCVGCCGLAPVVMVGDVFYGKLTPAKAAAMVEKLAETRTPV